MQGNLSTYNRGSTKYCEGMTFISKPVNSVQVEIAGKKTSTGEHIFTTRNQHRNNTSVGDTLRLNGYTGTRVTFFGTHEIVHTNGYHAYTSTIY